MGPIAYICGHVSPSSFDPQSKYQSWKEPGVFLVCLVQKTKENGPYHCNSVRMHQVWRVSFDSHPFFISMVLIATYFFFSFSFFEWHIDQIECRPCQDTLEQTFKQSKTINNVWIWVDIAESDTHGYILWLFVYYFFVFFFTICRLQNCFDFMCGGDQISQSISFIDSYY